ncbi:hypothetical protein [Agrobacterium tumefaciens]|uniref:hypothetical protein n=1 Tax=Agrobacterium tumefaciens TaxID=358 RepID=UPI0021CFAF46|nr:hypothetical protein [Agrobacterium tumefaciens]UXT31980.1 hypothetical protein FY138_00665 [Agrobacterium tumefaciens]
MTIAIGFGWWVVPALITVLTFGYAAFMSRDMGNDRFGAGAVITFGFYLLASVASLLAWLIWSLATP